MIQGRSKQKGNAWENAVAKILSQWLTKGERLDVLERSPASGGKFTANKKAGKDYQSIAGDLIAVSDEGHKLIDRFVIEIKHRNEEGINIISLVFRTAEYGIIAFWKKLLKECKQTNKLPMLIIKQNNKPVVIGLCKEGVELLQFNKVPHAVFKIGEKSMFLAKFDAFLEYADPTQLFK
jgi:hypothetical protein